MSHNEWEKSMIVETICLGAEFLGWILSPSLTTAISLEYFELCMLKGVINGTAEILLGHADPYLTPSLQHVC